MQYPPYNTERMKTPKDCTFCPNIIEKGEEALIWAGKPYCSVSCMRGGIEDATERDIPKR